MKAITEMREPVYYECRMRELLDQAKTQREEGLDGDYIETQLMIIKLATLASIND